MRYGRRARLSGETQWIELDHGEVAQAMKECLQFNMDSFVSCWLKARKEHGLENKSDEAKDLVEPRNLDIEAMRNRLFEACKLPAFTFIAQYLEKKVNQAKVTAAYG